MFWVLVWGLSFDSLGFDACCGFGIIRDLVLLALSFSTVIVMFCGC